MIKCKSLTDWHYAECRYAECHYADCRYADCHYADCRYAECHYAECCGAQQPHLGPSISYCGHCLEAHA